MTELLEESYLTWLYSQHSKVRRTRSSNTYWKLSKQLFTKEFVWFVANDDNRVEDGRALRIEYLEESGWREVDAEWLHMGCSVLEMLIGLSRRLSFEADGESRDWFWHLMSNVGLNEARDDRTYSEISVNNVLEKIIWRTYDRDGNGGLFPLRSPHEDQRQKELWYQMSAYLSEHR